MKPEVIDAGHKYSIPSLDGECQQVLTFVKRFDPADPSRFPGNTNAYPGTTLQSVIRVLIDRIDYLQNQIPHQNNESVKESLERCIWLLESRAAERHGYSFDYSPKESAMMPMCHHCGHVVCEKLGNAVEKI